MNDVLSVILGGGRGSRLFPLTLQRSKPAVPIAGKYRLIDIPISNCLNSGLRRMFVLTQFNSESLNKHVSLTYKFDLFSNAFVSILAAEQTEDDPHWYQGTADAVRQSLRHLETHRWKEALILSGDQLYQMDYRKLMESHRRQVADVTVAVTPVTADQAHAFGILKVNKQGRIVHFDEKPPRERLDGLVSEVPGIGPTFLASMGIYMFGRDLLVRTVSDPKLVPEARVHAYVYRGYWEDVGTIQSYYDANLALCQPVPPFDFYDTARPVYSNPRFLPATKIEGSTVENALVAEGSVIVQAEIRHALVGIRARLGRGVRVTDSLILGADYYETAEEVQRAAGSGLPPIGIGDDTVVRRAIIDKRVVVPPGAQIGVDHAQDRANGYTVSEGGVTVIGKGDRVSPSETVNSRS